MSSYFSNVGGFRKAKVSEDVDPMTSMTNVGDIMLVFACGLMAALVTAWSIDLAQFQEVEAKNELNKDDVEQLTEEMYGEGNGFVAKGKVYQDPATGKYYLVEEGEDE